MNLYAAGAVNVPSPNHSPRNGAPVRALVLHIMAGTLAGCDDWFRDPANQDASAHIGIGKDGTVHQYVSCAEAAWANGITTGAVPSDHGNAAAFIASLNGGNPNAYSVSIEHEGQSGDSLTGAQFDASVKVAAWLFGPGGALDGVGCNRMTVLRHSEIGSHPQCPGFPEDDITRYIAAVNAYLAGNTSAAQPWNPSQGVPAGFTQEGGDVPLTFTTLTQSEDIEAVKAEVASAIGADGGGFIGVITGGYTPKPGNKALIVEVKA